MVELAMMPSGSDDCLDLLLNTHGALLVAYRFFLPRVQREGRNAGRIGGWKDNPTTTLITVIPAEPVLDLIGNRNPVRAIWKTGYFDSMAIGGLLDAGSKPAPDHDPGSGMTEYKSRRQR
jgi:hypothetical protein